MCIHLGIKKNKNQQCKSAKVGQVGTERKRDTEKNKKSKKVKVLATPFLL